jgi:glycosyl hydrolase family 16
MKRRDFLFYTASSAGLQLPVLRSVAAASARSTSSASGDSPRGQDSAIIEDNFRGVEVTMPDGNKKLYPDTSRWAFTFWPGMKWPDSYGDGTNWLAGNFECQTYVTPLLAKVKGKEVPAVLRYDPFSIQPDGLHIKASLLSAEQQAAYQVGGYRRFGSGMLLSRSSFTFGSIRVAAKLPSARGSWPGLWLLPESHQWPPELDIFECMPWGRHQQQLHYGAIVPKGTDAHFGQWLDLGFDPAAGFHDYGLDWTPETLTGLIDGKSVWQQPTPSSLKQNMYLIINFAVGGKWPFNELNVGSTDSTAPERLSAGSDLIQGDYPADMIVKSVKVTAIKG